MEDDPELEQILKEYPDSSIAAIDKDRSLKLSHDMMLKVMGSDIKNIKSGDPLALD
jgi:hypothetical protein